MIRQLKPESEKVLSNHQCRAALKQAEDKYVALLYDLAVTQKCPDLKLSLVKLLNLEERARTAARVLARSWKTYLHFLHFFHTAFSLTPSYSQAMFESIVQQVLSKLQRQQAQARQAKQER